MGIDYEDMVLNGPWDALAAWRAAEVERLLACPGDCDNSGSVNFADLIAMLSEFGNASPMCDIDGSGVVDFADLVATLFVFGPCN